MNLEPRIVRLNGIDIALRGGGVGELLLFLHGFPECGLSWAGPMAALGEQFQLVAPDGRGFGRSSIAPGLDDYRPERLVADVLAVADACGAGRFTLVGHDWGGVVAWMTAAWHPARVRRLVIVNAPHPTLFQARLDDDPAQRAVSAYIARLTAVAAIAPEDLWAATFGETEARGLIGSAERAELLAGWRRPGAIEAMRNWYRAAPFDFAAVGGQGGGRLPGPLHVATPTLVLWGMDDSILLPGLLDGLDTLVPDLTIERVPGAGHAILRERPQLVAERIAAYVGARSR